MLERIKSLEKGVIGFRASGVVSKEDYENIVQPEIEKAIGKGEKIKFLYHFPPEFEAFSLEAVFKDFQVGKENFQQFEKMCSRC